MTSRAAVLCLILATWATCFAQDRYLEVTYLPSTAKGALALGVTYTLWIPEGVTRLRGVIVHQHGCGTGACTGGETAAYDLHWQALARKWDCALLGPSYHQDDKQNCRLWCDPRNGSSETFLRALSHFAKQSGHAEIEQVPWCLWGHSGGAFWASLMQTMYAERIVAVWLRSGTAFATWEKGEIPKPDIPAAAYMIPTICNPGVKEHGDARFDGAWTGGISMFKAYRARGALIGFAPDPRTGHECGDSRYLAIPFFDACLASRLPEKESTTHELRPQDTQAAWLATLLSESALPISEFRGDVAESVWLPNESVAKAWSEYVKTGAVGDASPPPPPTGVTFTTGAGGSTELRWLARADLESGVMQFVVLRDDRVLGRVPEKPIGRFGRSLFQSMSYHDTPERPLPEMVFIDAGAETRKKHVYRIRAVNTVGLESEPSDAAVPAIPSAAGEAAKSAIAAMLAEQAAAWNKADIEKFMDYYWRSDELTFSSSGKTTRGWQPTKENYQRRYPTPEKMGQLDFDQLETTLLGDSAAMVLGRWHLTRTEGNVEGNFSLVLRRINGQWRIVHDHTSLAAP